jgi:hypothetical protein
MNLTEENKIIKDYLQKNNNSEYSILNTSLSLSIYNNIKKKFNIKYNSIHSVKKKYIIKFI